MNFNINRENILPGLQSIISVVDRRQSLPILSNLLISLGQNSYSITATDMEVELQIEQESEIGFSETEQVTLPARKLLDICKSLPEEANIQFECSNDKAVVKSARSRFTLASLPPQEFPVTDVDDFGIQFVLTQSALKSLLEDTMFAMAQQDVRYYLNGLLFELSPKQLRAVATDGHRLALKEIEADISVDEAQQVIVPRKAVQEIVRLISDSDEDIKIQLSKNHIRFSLDGMQFTSKLIDGRFPDYQRVVPAECDHPVIANKDALRQTLSRASILSNEKYRGVRITLLENALKAQAQNPEQEEAEEELEVSFDGEGFEIGFNVSYLLDAVGAIKSDQVKLNMTDPNSSCLILPTNEESTRYVVMPMRL